MSISSAAIETGAGHAPSATHGAEVSRGERFEFGRNWARFLERLNEERVGSAVESLKRPLGAESLEGKTFLDVGCGSGLFSLAARRLGARVHSFDYDPLSVACARELRRRLGEADTSPGWRIEPGSALDRTYLEGLGQFDIVYSWGVLHHTGRMWDALELAGRAVRPGGQLYIALYNDQGSKTVRWRRVKRLYNRLPRAVQPAFAALAVAPDEGKAALRALLSGRPGEYLRTWTRYQARRGMSKWRDIVDWVGGHPYEAAKVDEVFSFYRARGFALEYLRCGGGLGCNEFVFRHLSPGPLALPPSPGTP
ncbi:MAG TPA: class I SAM-dependent methyltransferase [Vicinamibacterales bacterium]|nr:class I SAM-dependent methyltransferase [Vicinamibacterales bacterium]